MPDALKQASYGLLLFHSSTELQASPYYISEGTSMQEKRSSGRKLIQDIKCTATHTQKAVSNLGRVSEQTGTWTIVTLPSQQFA